MNTLFLAHQGGWDEILMFAVPAAAAIYGLRWAERRARERARSEAEEPGQEPATDSSS